MKARYSGDCHRCPDPIQPGEEIVLLRRGRLAVEMIHARCASGQEDARRPESTGKALS